MKRYLLSLLLALCCAAQSGVQTASSKAFLQKLEALAVSISVASRPDVWNFGRAEVANMQLHTWLLIEGEKHPEWLQAGSLEFEAAGVHVLTSADRRFRIYRWDTETNEPTHFYNGVIQYLATPGHAATMSLGDMKSMDNSGDPGHWYSAVHSVRTKSGETFYLPIFHGRYSN